MCVRACAHVCVIWIFPCVSFYFCLFGFVSSGSVLFNLIFLLLFFLLLPITKKNVVTVWLFVDGVCWIISIFVLFASAIDFCSSRGRYIKRDYLFTSAIDLCNSWCLTLMETVYLLQLVLTLIYVIPNVLTLREGGFTSNVRRKSGILRQPVHRITVLFFYL